MKATSGFPVHFEQDWKGFDGLIDVLQVRHVMPATFPKLLNTCSDKPLGVLASL